MKPTQFHVNGMLHLFFKMQYAPRYIRTFHPKQYFENFPDRENSKGRINFYFCQDTRLVMLRN